MIPVRYLQWESLPELILEKIFSYLDPDERARVSGVTETWAHVADCPDYWRNPVFSFSEANTKPNKLRSCPRQIVRKYGQFFRNLTIVYKHNPRNSLKFLPHQIKGLLASLKEQGVQLESIRLDKTLRWTIYGNLGRRLELMKDFLATQTNLSKVDFENAIMALDHVLEILEISGPERVTSLNLQNSVISWIFVDQEPHRRYLRVISKFTNLKTLCINYEYMSDRFLKLLCSGINGQLESFSVLYIGYNHAFGPLLSDRGWTLLKKSCPNLWIEFTIDLIRRDLFKERDAWKIHHVVAQNVLSPAIPLGSICIRTPSWCIHDQVIFHLLKENYGKTLREAVFNLRGYNNAGIVDRVCEFVKRCSILNSLTLRVRFPKFGMHELFNRLYNVVALERKKRPVFLKEIHVTFRGLPWSEQQSVPGCRITYGDLFRDLGVTLKLKNKE